MAQVSMLVRSRKGTFSEEAVSQLEGHLRQLGLPEGAVVQLKRPRSRFGTLGSVDFSALHIAINLAEKGLWTTAFVGVFSCLKEWIKHRNQKITIEAAENKCEIPSTMDTEEASKLVGNILDRQQALPVAKKKKQKKSTGADKYRPRKPRGSKPQKKKGRRKHGK
jgi:hypothetical protein